MASSSRSEKALLCTTLALLRERMSSLINLRNASTPRFLRSICAISVRNWSDRMEISGLLMPTAARMSTISVEITARLTICRMANSRSCSTTPIAPLLFISASRIAWKKPTSSRMVRASSEADTREKALDSASHHDQAFLRCSIQPVIETVVHVAHDFVLLHHHRDGLGFIDTGIFPVALRVLSQRRFKIMSDTDIVHDQSGGFVAEHAIDPRNRLHQAMPLHGLVHIHRVHAGRIKTGEPHITHDHQFE